MTNLAARIAVAAVGIPLILAVSMWGGVAFLMFVLVASSLALREFYKLAQAKGARPMMSIGMIAGVMVVLSFFHPKLQVLIFSLAEVSGAGVSMPTQFQLLSIVVILSVATFCCVELFRSSGSRLVNIGTTVLGILYVSLFFGTVVGIRELFHPLTIPMARYFPGESSFMDPEAIRTVYTWGGYTVIAIFACIWLCDTAAYFVGTSMGRHKLFPRVSPNKTWEGAIAGFVAAVGTAVGAQTLFLQFMSVGQAVVFGIVVGIFGQVGDLVESSYKRDAGVKDSSSIIPGHGGVLDRFDSLILVSPLLYLYLDFIVFS